MSLGDDVSWEERAEYAGIVEMFFSVDPLGASLLATLMGGQFAQLTSFVSDPKIDFRATCSLGLIGQTHVTCSCTVMRDGMPDDHVRLGSDDSGQSWFTGEARGNAQVALVVLLKCLSRDADDVQMLLARHRFFNLNSTLTDIGMDTPLFQEKPR